jgi:dsDNA-specific endonuclease/ATPase MutS2
MRMSVSSPDLSARIFAAELRKDMPILDIHGEYPDAIDVLLDQFIYRHRDESALQIIHGHGTGSLQARVISVCNVHPLVDAVIKKNGYVLLLL